MRQAYLVLTLHISLTVLMLLELLHDPNVVFARALLLSDSVAIDGGPSEAAAAAAVEVDGFSTQPSASVATR
jgi:hypothetical protein